MQHRRNTEMNTAVRPGELRSVATARSTSSISAIKAAKAASSRSSGVPTARAAVQRARAACGVARRRRDERCVSDRAEDRRSLRPPVALVVGQLRRRPPLRPLDAVGGLCGAALAEPQQRHRGLDDRVPRGQPRATLDIAFSVGQHEGVVEPGAVAEVAVDEQTPGAGVGQHRTLLLGEIAPGIARWRGLERLAGQAHAVDALIRAGAEHQHGRQRDVPASCVAVLARAGRAANQSSSGAGSPPRGLLSIDPLTSGP